MQAVNNPNYLKMLISLFVAFLLMITPLPAWLLWFRPQWVLAVVLFWIITRPEYYGVLFSWCVGLLADFLSGTPLCLHALIFVFLAYLAINLHQILLHSPPWQQALLIGMFAGISIVLQSIFAGMLGYSMLVMRNELSVISTVICWPLIFFLLEDSEKSPYATKYS